MGVASSNPEACTFEAGHQNSCEEKGLSGCKKGLETVPFLTHDSWFDLFGVVGTWLNIVKSTFSIHKIGYLPGQHPVPLAKFSVNTNKMCLTFLTTMWCVEYQFRSSRSTVWSQELIITLCPILTYTNNISSISIIIRTPLYQLINYCFLFFSGCDVTFTSTSNALSKNGTFHAPTFLNPEEHVIQCTYSFMALENERVMNRIRGFWSGRNAAGVLSRAFR